MLMYDGIAIEVVWECLGCHAAYRSDPTKCECGNNVMIRHEADTGYDPADKKPKKPESDPIDEYYDDFYQDGFGKFLDSSDDPSIDG